MPIAASRLFQSAAADACEFCSGGCRQAGYRTRKWASRYEGPGPLDVRNTLDGSGPYNGNFGDRGIRGPMFVVERELFAGLEWTPADFEDGATLEELKAMVEFHLERVAPMLD